MNHVRIDSSNIVRFIRNSGFLLLSLFACLLPVKAELTIGDYNNTYGNNVTDLVSFFGLGEASSISGPLSNSNKYWRYRVVSSTGGFNHSASGNTQLVTVGVFYYYSVLNAGNAYLRPVFYYDAGAFPDAYVSVNLQSSSDRISWSSTDWIDLSLSYQYSTATETGNLIKYQFRNSASWNVGIDYSDTGNIPILGTTNPGDGIRVISGNLSYWPWNGTTSSGGRHWEDGTNLDGSNTSRYSQIYLVMDSNNDNSVSQEEVNYYNYTYNTNYDYSVFNEGDSFDQDQFLYWVAKQIEVGVENPGGGTGSGGGSGSVSGGISVTDSFTQTQTQTIEENAVNVTVNNNNSLTQENYQELNSLINNYNGSSDDETDPFQQAIGNFQAFHAIALAFAGLASVVFGWLPWWVTALLGAMFSMVCVFIVLRLIHLFK